MTNVINLIKYDDECNGLQSWESIISDGQLTCDIESLEEINKEIKDLEQTKSKLINKIITQLGHDKEGEKSYCHSSYKVTCKTPMTYVLDKKKYDQIIDNIPVEFNPIKTSIAYNVDKRLFDHYVSIAPREIRIILEDLITKKPAKANISIQEM